MIEQQRAQVFAATAQKAGSALIDFAESRAELLGRKDNESFAQYEQRISTENADAQSQYSNLYSVKIARLRDGFALHGLNRPELDEFYQRPGSIIAIREIGRTVFDMGSELRSAGILGAVEKWWRRPTSPTAVSPSWLLGAPNPNHVSPNPEARPKG